MGRSTKTYEEKILEKDSKIERLMQELKQQEAQQWEVFLKGNAEKSGYGHRQERKRGVRSFLIPFFL